MRSSTASSAWSAPPTDYYFTDAITDRAIGMVEQRAPESPFPTLHARGLADPRARGGHRPLRRATHWDAIAPAPRGDAVARRCNTAGDLRRDPAAWPGRHAAPRLGRPAVMSGVRGHDRPDDRSRSAGDGALRRLGQYDNTLILFLSGQRRLRRVHGSRMAGPSSCGRTQRRRRITMGNRPGWVSRAAADLP